MPAFASDLGAGDAGFAYSALLMATAAGAVFGGFLLEGKGWLQAESAASAVLVRHLLVCVSWRLVCLIQELLFVAGPLVLRRHPESCVLFFSQAIVQMQRAQPSAAAA